MLRVLHHPNTPQSSLADMPGFPVVNRPRWYKFPGDVSKDVFEERRNTLCTDISPHLPFLIFSDFPTSSLSLYERCSQALSSATQRHIKHSHFAVSCQGRQLTVLYGQHPKISLSLASLLIQDTDQIMILFLSHMSKFLDSAFK